MVRLSRRCVGKSLLSGFEWYRWRWPGALSTALVWRETASRRLGLTASGTIYVGSDASVETKLMALVGPFERELAGTHELTRAELGRLAPLDNRFRDLRCTPTIDDLAATLRRQVSRVDAWPGIRKI